MSHKLFIFTDVFPFGRGEQPFVEPEIRFLAKDFEVTIVSIAIKKATEEASFTSSLPSGVRVLHCGKPQYIRRLLHAAAFPFTQIGRQEIIRIKQKEQFVFRRILKSALSYSRAYSLKSQFKNAGIFENSESSLYYTFWFSAALLACVLEKSHDKKMKIASRIHGYDLYNERMPFCWQPMQSYKAESADAIIFLTTAAQEYFKQNFCEATTESVFSNKAYICPLGCLAARGTPQKRRNESFRIVSCSNVIPLKRVHLIAQALARLDKSEIEWVHFGDGSELERVKRIADQGNVRATFRGFVSNEEVLRYYANNYVDLFITTSSTEGLPVSIQEALAYGIPIVGTNVGGIPEEIDGNGILLSAQPSVEEIAEAIDYIYNLSEVEISEMRQRSLAIWQTRYDQDKNLHTTLSILKKLSQA